MATFPGPNNGAWPIDPTSEVGQFRLVYGDIAAEEYEPAVPNWRNFSEMGDDAIQALLDRAGGSLYRAIGDRYLALAGEASKVSKTVKDYDLTVDLTKRAGDLRDQAKMWFDRADVEEAALEEEGFNIVPTGQRTVTRLCEACARPACVCGRW